MTFEANLADLQRRLDAIHPRPRRLVIQLPDGLKMRALDIIAALEKNGFDVWYAANPTYGACDLATAEARRAHADLLVHVGHSKFYVDIPSEISVLYFPWAMDISFQSIDLITVPEQRLGLVTTIQHRDVLDTAKQWLEEKGKQVVIAGQILGCWSPSAAAVDAQVDAFLFIGSGHFHPLAVKTEKPVYVCDVEQGKIEKLDMALFEKRRWAGIYRARDARRFGILVTTKEGQHELLGMAEDIQRRLRDAQKDAIIIMLDEITNTKLQGIRVDAFINTACPRILDDVFDKPIINAGDIDEVL